MKPRTVNFLPLWSRRVIQPGNMYLVAVMDWFSRRTLAWRLSNPLTTDFCIEALDASFAAFGAPKIFNTDQIATFALKPGACFFLLSPMMLLPFSDRFYILATCPVFGERLTSYRPIFFETSRSRANNGRVDTADTWCTRKWHWGFK